MERQVQFRQMQEMQPQDFNDPQTYAADGIGTVLREGITPDKAFTGLTVAATSATDITVAPGKFYWNGKIYGMADVAPMSVFQHLPVATRRIVSLVAWGETVNAKIEPRDFITDIDTGATEPQAVAMEKVNQLRLSLVPGSQSADPVPPTFDDNAVLVAIIVMGTQGIIDIQFQNGNRLPSVKQNRAAIHELTVWRAGVSPQVDSIQTQIAALQQASADTIDRARFTNLATEFARLREMVDTPEGAIMYDADRFLDDDETDLALTGSGSIVDAGLNFGKAASAKFPLQLFNPLETRVKKYADNFVLPAFTEEAKIFTDGYAGDIALSQYQVTTKVTKLVTEAVQRYVAGSWYNPNASWLYSFAPGGNFPGSYYWSAYNTYHYSPGYYITDTREYYKETDEEVSYNGSMIAQTMLAPNAFWLTSIDLSFTDIGPSGNVTVGICYTNAGQPDMSRTLVATTINHADLKKYPLETNIPMPPAWIEAGKRYAIFVITQGAHRVATVSANNYTQGTLFYSSDQAWFEGDLTKDLMFSINGAAFDRARIEVNLESLSLADGITDLDIATEMIVPSGTELTFEVQIAGVWRKLTEGDVLFGPKPNLLPLRMVMVGTRDAMPGVQFGTNRVEVSRVATSLTHVSTLRTLPAPSDDITIILSAVRFDPGNHTLTCQLVDAAGANPVNPSITDIRTEAGPEGMIITRKTFTFALGAPRSTYKIKEAGTRTVGALPFSIIERTDVAL